MKILNKVFLLILLSLFFLIGESSAQRTGVEIWTQTCGNCHLIQPANRYTASRWNTINVHMKIYARLTDLEAETVLQFLQAGAKVTVAPQNALDSEIIASSESATGLDTKLSEEQIREWETWLMKTAPNKDSRKSKRK